MHQLSREGFQRLESLQALQERNLNGMGRRGEPRDCMWPLSGAQLTRKIHWSTEKLKVHPNGNTCFEVSVKMSAPLPGAVQF